MSVQYCSHHWSLLLIGRIACCEAALKMKNATDYTDFTDSMDFKFVKSAQSVAFYAGAMYILTSTECSCRSSIRGMVLLACLMPSTVTVIPTLVARICRIVM
jgi:hypothetical protein